MTPRTKGWLQIIAAVVCFWIAFTVFPPTTLKDGAKKTMCLSNLKQLATAQLVYLDENNQRFQASAWSDPLLPYTKNEDLLHCSSTYVDGKGHYGYAMNYELVDAKATTAGEPESTPLFFEIDALAKDVVANFEARSTSRHRRGGSKPAGNVVFLDSHARFLPLDSPLKR